MFGFGINVQRLLLFEGFIELCNCNGRIENWETNLLESFNVRVEKAKLSIAQVQLQCHPFTVSPSRFVWGVRLKQQKSWKHFISAAPFLTNLLNGMNLFQIEPINTMAYYTINKIQKNNFAIYFLYKISIRLEFVI